MKHLRSQPTPPRRAGHCRPAAATAGFTLVELLTVMGIITLLLTATLPAIRGLTGASGRRGAVTGLLGALDQARALAISEGRTTYVVFVTPNPNLQGLPPNPAPDPRKCATGYAIFQDADNVYFQPAQRSAWLSLPVGVAFKVVNDNGQTGTVLNRLLTTSDPTFAVPSGDSSIQPMHLPYLRFDATGASDVSSSLARLLLFEGSVSTNGTELPTKRAAGGSDPTIQRFMWEEIRLNYATGRARYTADPNDISIAAAQATPTPTP